jgi:polyhydroxybutyrate depolymerase
MPPRIEPWLMKRVLPLAPFLLLVLLVLAISIEGQGWRRARRLPAGDQVHAIQVGDAVRRYVLHVPESNPKDGTRPLVLVFHGGGGSAGNMPNFTGFDRVADANGFIVAYPNGIDRHWNDSRGLSPADDVAFIRALIAKLQRAYKVDPGRVYATGISNGGFFSNRLACDLTDKLTAIASVAATMPEALVPECQPSRPISVMYMQGTKDPLVPIGGGPVARTHGNAVSLERAAQFWREWNHTSAQPVEAQLPDTAHDGTTVRRQVFGKGKDGTEVVVYTIEGGGHTWPGGRQYLPVFLVGKASRNLDATQVIWEFFASHHR